MDLEEAPLPPKSKEKCKHRKVRGLTKDEALLAQTDWWQKPWSLHDVLAFATEVPGFPVFLNARGPSRTPCGRSDVGDAAVGPAGETLEVPPLPHHSGHTRLSSPSSLDPNAPPRPPLHCDWEAH